MPALKLELLAAWAVLPATGQADGTSFMLFSVC